MHCRVCSARGPHETYDVPEMMFGWRTPHRYLRCSDCGCLQLVEPPPDLARFYGPGYYSFAHPRPQGLKAQLLRWRNRQLLFGGSAFGALLARRFPTRQFDVLEPLRGRLHPGSVVLDVGCGSGALVAAMRLAGMPQASGVDAFIDADQHWRGARLVRRGTLADVPGPLDLVMFHHSLEHMPDPEAPLRQAGERLRPGGHCLVRVPLVSSWAWQRYGVHWVQLDAPRHFWLHTERSLRLLAERCGLRCDAVVYDSTAFQFWGSEQYRRGVPLRDARSYAHDPGAFSPAQIAQWEAEAARANAAGAGDQAAFYFSRPA